MVDEAYVWDQKGTAEFVDALLLLSSNTSSIAEALGVNSTPQLEESSNCPLESRVFLPRQDYSGSGPATH